MHVSPRAKDKALQTPVHPRLRRLQTIEICCEMLAGKPVPSIQEAFLLELRIVDDLACKDCLAKSKAHGVKQVAL